METSQSLIAIRSNSFCRKERRLVYILAEGRRIVECGFFASGDCFWSGYTSVRSKGLDALPLHQIRLLISDIIVGVAENCLFVFFVEAALQFSGPSHPKGIRLNDCFLGN